MSRPATLAAEPVRSGGTFPDGLGPTLRLVWDFIRRGAADARIHQLSRDLVADLPDRRRVHPELQELAQIRRIWSWTRQNIRYVHDQWNPETQSAGETIQNVFATLRLGAGDCDDLVVLTGALLVALGTAVEPWLAGAGQPTHIFLVATTAGGNAVSVDTTLRGPFGSLPVGPGWLHWPARSFLEN